MQDELSRMFGRVVDLHTPASLSRYFRDEVVAAAQDQLSRHDPSVSLRHMRDHAYELAALVRGRSPGDLDSGPPASKQGREHEGATTPRVTHARPARGSRPARRQFETGQPDPSIHRPCQTTRRPSGSKPRNSRVSADWPSGAPVPTREPGLPSHAQSTVVPLIARRSPQP